MPWPLARFFSCFWVSTLAGLRASISWVGTHPAPSFPPILYLPSLHPPSFLSMHCPCPHTPAACRYLAFLTLKAPSLPQARLLTIWATGCAPKGITHLGPSAAPCFALIVSGPSLVSGYNASPRGAEFCYLLFVTTAPTIQESMVDRLIH